jgi:hypothetical protein
MTLEIVLQSLRIFTLFDAGTQARIAGGPPGLDRESEANLNDIRQHEFTSSYIHHPQRCCVVGIPMVSCVGSISLAFCAGFVGQLGPKPVST